MPTPEQLAALDVERHTASRDAQDEGSPSFADVLGLPDAPTGASRRRPSSKRRASASGAANGTPEVDRAAQKRLENTGLIAPVTKEVSLVMPTAPAQDAIPLDAEQEEARPLGARQAHGLDPLEYKVSGVQRARVGLTVVICSVIVALAAVVIAIKL